MFATVPRGRNFRGRWRVTVTEMLMRPGPQEIPKQRGGPTTTKTHKPGEYLG